MCGETAADGYAGESYGNSVFAPKVVKARKPHRCDDCRNPILVGRLYAKLAGIYEGDFWTSTLCGLCEIKRRWLVRNGHAWMVNLIASDYEYCRFGDHSQPPPNEP